jgi:hypothetical protein
VPGIRRERLLVKGFGVENVAASTGQRIRDHGRIQWSVISGVGSP